MSFHQSKNASSHISCLFVSHCMPSLSRLFCAFFSSFLLLLLLQNSKTPQKQHGRTSTARLLKEKGILIFKVSSRSRASSYRLLTRRRSFSRRERFFIRQTRTQKAKRRVYYVVFLLPLGEEAAQPPIIDRDSFFLYSSARAKEYFSRESENNDVLRT